MISGSWNGAMIVSEENEILYGHISGSWGRYPVYKGPVHYINNERCFCEYCYGNTKMDDRGNCVACGAPKRDSVFVGI